MILLRLIAIISFLSVFFVQNTVCAADNYRVKEAIIDNSDKMVLISGYDNVRNNAGSIYIQGVLANSVNILNKVTISTLTAPNRYVIDIPHATLVGASKVYDVQNSSTISNIQMSQFSSSPNIVRIVFTLHGGISPSKFKTYTDGSNLIVKYKDAIIDNSIQYKFYTPSGDMDKTAGLQNTSSVLSYNNSNNTYELNARLQTKYYLSKVSQNTDGLILRGLGSISLQRAYYAPDGSRAEVILDNASASSKIAGKTYEIPSSDKDLKAQLTITKLSAKKIRLTLDKGQNLRDYRFIVSPDGQCLFIAHRNYISKTVLSSNLSSVKSYKMSKTNNGYNLFELTFNKPVTYNVFEQNNNFYLDINNLSDYNSNLFEQMLKTSDIKIETVKIANDKTRFIIPSSNLNLSYANIESNSKSIKLCFKDKIPTQTQIAQNTTTNIEVQPKPQTNKDDAVEVKLLPKEKITSKNQNIEVKPKTENENISYVPKSEEKTPAVINPESKKDSILAKLKGKKEIPVSNSDNKTVVIDPGHGGADSGAIGGGIYEKSINLSIAKLVEEKLLQKGIKVYMTRDKDITMTLEDRANFSNETKPAIFVSIHTNSTVQEDIYGLETHYFKDDSLNLAELIHSKFASEDNLTKWETKDRGVIKSRFYVINHTEAPSVLVEVGFISNNTERSKLITRERQEQISDSITEAIAEYLGIEDEKQ